MEGYEIATESKIPVHEADYEESVTLKCPKCKKYNPILWDGMEEGEQHKCEHCDYIWKVA